MNTKLQEITDRFVSKQGYLQKGAGYLAKTFGVKKDFIYQAKIAARTIISDLKETQLQTIISDQEEVIAKLISEESSGGITTKKFETSKPLSPKEIEEIAGVDGISTRLSNVWSKLQASGKWTYSIQIRFEFHEFYVKEELTKKLKEIFTNDIEPVKLPVIEGLMDDNLALFIYIADDHVGLKNDNSIFGNKYDGEVYEARMMELIAKATRTITPFGHVYIVRLGDEADGYNAKTTRYDHNLNSESNKAQFDIYTSVNKKFYDALFASGVGKKYSVVNCNNSNHSGKGFSYMLNKAVEFYVSAKYKK